MSFPLHRQAIVLYAGISLGGPLMVAAVPARNGKVRKIALLQPIKGFSEVESAARIRVAAKKLGIEVRSFRKSEDIVDFKPDFVLVFSCQAAKLTPFPTYGILNAPVDYYLQVPRFLRNVLTYDAYFTWSKEVERWLKDITFGVRKLCSPISRFAATVQATEFQKHDYKEARLACVGSNRKSAIFLPLFRRLGDERICVFYGPPGAWAQVHRDSYKGGIPADGESALSCYRVCGAGLNLVNQDSIQDALPSIRILEIIAAGAIAISGRHAVIERLFGDNILYIDQSVPVIDIATQIRDRLAWIRKNPDSAARKAKEAHRIFIQSCSIDVLLENVFDLHKRILVGKGYVPDPNERIENLPSVTYIIRTGGGRPPYMLRRALSSLAAQDYPKLTVLLVLFRELPEVDRLKADFPTLNIEAVDDPGGLRSTAICRGMQNVKTDLFGLLDDDDDLHPNHVRSLVKTLDYHSRRNLRGEIGVAYSASIEAADEEERPEHEKWEDEQELVLRQRRCIEHYGYYNTSKMTQHAWYLMSNSWLARRTLIDSEVLNDPHIHTCEDLYLMLQLAQKTYLAFSGEVTAVHRFHGHGQSTFIDEYMHRSDTSRIALRAWNRHFPADVGGREQHDPFGDKKGDHIEQEATVNLINVVKLGKGVLRSGNALLLSQAPIDEYVLQGPSMNLYAGLFTLTHYFEIDEVGTTFEKIVEIGIIFDDGRAVVEAVVFGDADLFYEGDLLRADIVFEVTPETEIHKISFRLKKYTTRPIKVRNILLYKWQKGIIKTADSIKCPDRA
jgi:hypothetical protein